jgi:WD40 repeat protein
MLPDNSSVYRFASDFNLCYEGEAAMSFLSSSEANAGHELGDLVEIYKGSFLQRACLKGHTGPVLVRFSPHNDILATSSTKDEFVKLWDVAKGNQTKNLSGHHGGVIEIQFSANGQTLAVRCGDRSVRLWNMGRRRRSES